MYLKIFLQIFIMDLWLSFYYKRGGRRIWKTTYLFRRKHWKMHNLYSFNRKRSYKNWLKRKRTYKYCDCFLEYTDFKDDLIQYKCLCCNKNYQQKFNAMLKERNNFLIQSNFLTTTTKFILLLRKVAYPYQYMDDREKLKHHYLQKKVFIVTQILKILLIQITRM